MLILANFIEIPGRTCRGIFKSRSNRFLAFVEVNGKEHPCFLPNPGRMHELLKSGVEVILREVIKKGRKTQFDLIGVFHKEEIVSLDTRIPNKLVLDALKKRTIQEFSNFNNVKPEITYGHSRLDFLLTNQEEKCLLEVKSCSLVENGVALFPDAPTLRGKRHLMDLIEAKKDGYRACVLFIIQRLKPKLFTSNDKVDPDFATTLREAIRKGVEVYAYYSEFTGKKFFLRNKIKIDNNLKKLG